MRVQTFPLTYLNTKSRSSGLKLQFQRGGFSREHRRDLRGSSDQYAEEKAHRGIRGINYSHKKESQS